MGEFWSYPESRLLIDPGWNGSLSPDGSLVTFLGSQIDGPAGRWVAGTDGMERRLLPDVYRIPCWSTPAGTWSPDGNRIVCSEASKVIVLDIAAGAATPLAYGRGVIWLDDHTLLVSVWTNRPDAPNGRGREPEQSIPPPHTRSPRRTASRAVESGSALDGAIQADVERSAIGLGRRTNSIPCLGGSNWWRRPIRGGAKVWTCKMCWSSYRPRPAP
jgi:hypothetical protein